MADPRALTRLVDELLFRLRREGLAIAPSQAIDVLRAIAAVGWDDRGKVRDAIACVVVQRQRDRGRFDGCFDRFFATDGGPRGSLFERLAAQGFAPHELDALRELLAAMARTGVEGANTLGELTDRGATIDRLLGLAGVTQTLSSMQSPLQVGFYTHRVVAELGVGDARKALGGLRSRLADALGRERADALADAIASALAAVEDDARAFVADTLARRDAENEGQPRLATTPFAALSDREIEEVRAAVQRFAERLRGGERVRRRRAKQGRIDVHATMRRSLASFGVPFVLRRKRRRRDKPELFLLCDVSDSVRAAAAFMLELAYAAQELFDRTRSFVFVSDLGETTKLFERMPIRAAIAHAYSGSVVSVAHNSNYGRALRSFEAQHLADVSRRSTVVVLGDGRTNYQDEGLDALDRIRERARAVLWLCPEPRSRWGIGDSAMARYAARCTRALEVATAHDLDGAARLLVTAR